MFTLKTTTFIELTRISDRQRVAVNPSGIAAFGEKQRGCWISLIGSPDDICVEETYEQIKVAIRSMEE